MSDAVTGAVTGAVGRGPSHALHAWAVDGVGEVVRGTDLADLLRDAGLRDGDVVLVTSKVVSKAEGRVAREDRDRAVREETVRVVARRGATTIVEGALGLVMAAAGVDASNVAPGHVVRLPEDPDASARRLREALAERYGVDVAVVVTDTAGRAWRVGQTEIAVGLAGLEPLESFAGRVDGYGNPLAVTAPAVADELANLAELVTGKLGGRPLSVVRGLGARLLPPGEHGPGARALQRPREQDLFALGTREAVVAAVAGVDADCFGPPAPVEELRDALARCGLDARTEGREGLLVGLPADPAAAGDAAARAAVLAHAHGWTRESEEPGSLRIGPRASGSLP